MRALLRAAQLLRSAADTCGGRFSVNKVSLTPQGLVDGIEDLVTLPEVALRIARMVEDPSSSATDIGREISHDAALTARLLRIANSPALGHHGKIATISRAITVLGVRQVRDLTVGLTAIRTFEGISNELVTMESFWRHSFLCAVAAAAAAVERRAAHVRHWCLPADDFRHHIVDEGRIVTQLPVLVGETVERQESAADRVARRVVASDH